MQATYVSVWSDGVVCTSPCRYNPVTKVCDDIGTASNAEEADTSDSLVDEYVLLTDGEKLREKDGVTFDY